MQIYIGASRPKERKCGASLIMWHLGTDYSHVYIRFNVPQLGRELVFQAAHGSVHLIAYEHFIDTNIAVKEVPLSLSNEQFIEFTNNAIELLQQPYSILELVQIFLSDISGGRIHFENAPGFICSELTGKMLTDLGHKFNKELWMLTPKDIMESING